MGNLANCLGIQNKMLWPRHVGYKFMYGAGGRQQQGAIAEHTQETLEYASRQEANQGEKKKAVGEQKPKQPLPIQLECISISRSTPIALYTHRT